MRLQRYSDWKIRVYGKDLISLKIILPHPTVLYILKGAVASNTLVESRECKYIPGELTQNTVINSSKLYVCMIIYIFIYLWVSQIQFVKICILDSSHCPNIQSKHKRRNFEFYETNIIRIFP